MPFSRFATAAVLVAATLLATPALAQELITGASYDPAVPTVSSVLGYESGQQITRSADVRRYFEALRAAAPDRMVIGDYARTHEGRPVFWAAVGSPANIARLDAIKATSRALADPRRTTAAQARTLIADQPVIVWLMYSVHGNEISPADASMAAARHLLASRDPAVQAWLANTVVVFVPTQNPDGRERFLSGFSGGYGTEPNPDPLSAERDEPWPSGRYNHDLFDLNRDWFIQTQPETRGHAAQIRDWRPQVLVDAHEMGTDESFFFPPEAQPLNPWLTPEILESREIIGRNTARRFDAAGVPYFNRQVYDAFYPGYGDGWPAYFGAVSMTYEQGSARGLAARRSSGEILTFRDTVRNHLIASLSTIEASSANHDRLLNNFYAYNADGLSGGRGAYLLSRAAHDPGEADRLAGLLVRSGVEVGRADAAFTACGKSWPAGSYVVTLAQPQRRMAEVLLARDVAVPPAFLAEQERRRARGLGDEIYDVTAWSLPLMFNTPADRCASTPSVSLTAATEAMVAPVAIANANGAFGWLVAPGAAGGRLMTAALRQGVALRSMDKAFTHAGRRWPSGTLVIPRVGAAADLPARMAEWAAATGAEVVGVDESWVSDGPSFGSGDAVALRAPRIALAWDDPTDPSAAGATRYVIEREFGYPVTVVRTASLADADLGRFQVVILPDGGNYEARLGAEGVTHLREWVDHGGTLIGLGGATRLLTDPDSKLLASRRENAAPVDGEDGGDKEADDDKARVDGALIASETDYLKLVGESERGPDSVAGVLARADVDAEHWLSAGVAPSLNVLVRGGDIYTPLKRGEGTNVARFGSADDLLASGQLWAENRAQLAFKPAVMVSEHGRGQVIAFAQDPTFRGYMDGMKTILLNALFRGPAHSSPTWAE